MFRSRYCATANELRNDFLDRLCRVNLMRARGAEQRCNLGKVGEEKEGESPCTHFLATTSREGDAPGQCCRDRHESDASRYLGAGRMRQTSHFAVYIAAVSAFYSCRG